MGQKSSRLNLISDIILLMDKRQNTFFYKDYHRLLYIYSRIDGTIYFIDDEKFPNGVILPDQMLFKPATRETVLNCLGTDNIDMGVLTSLLIRSKEYKELKIEAGKYYVIPNINYIGDSPNIQILEKMIVWNHNELYA